MSHRSLSARIPETSLTLPLGRGAQWVAREAMMPTRREAIGEDDVSTRRCIYSIGEFSKITGLSIKALRLYHDKGLLIPESVDEHSSYRSYSAENLTRARAIARLKAMLVPLETIGEILACYDEESEVLAFFTHHRDEIAARVAAMRGIVATLDAIIAEEQEVRIMLEQYEFDVEEKTVDTLLVASIRWKGKYSDCGKAFSKLYGQLGRYVCGKPMDLLYDEGYKEDDADVETALPVRKGKPAEGITIRELPGGKAISLIHKGPYGQIGRAYEKLTNYAKQHNLDCSLPARQVYLKGPGLIFKNPKNYLTEVLFLLK